MTPASPLDVSEARKEALRCRDLNTLAPKFRAAVVAALAECRALGLDAVVFETRRCDELQAIYQATGASRAASALYSWHGYGLAVDVISASEGWDSEAFFQKVAAVFTRHGCDWGGDWKTFRDLPHFQWGRCKASPSDEARRLFAAGGVPAVWQAVGAD